jgi:hypothetical protein
MSHAVAGVTETPQSLSASAIAVRLGAFLQFGLAPVSVWCIRHARSLSAPP